MKHKTSINLGFSTLTNFLYLIPIFILIGKDFVLVYILSLLFIFSLLYHLLKKNTFENIDTFLGYLVAIFLGIKIFLNPINTLYSATILLAVLSALSIRYFIEDKTRDDIWHGVWHCLVATVLILYSIVI